MLFPFAEYTHYVKKSRSDDDDDLKAPISTGLCSLSETIQGDLGMQHTQNQFHF